MPVSRILLLLFPLFIWSRSAYSIELPITVASLQATFESQRLCSNLKVTELCRAFPWRMRAFEGVHLVDNTAVIIFREDIPETAPFAGLARSVQGGRTEEVLSLLALTEPDMSTAITLSPATGFLVMILAQEPPHAPLSIFFAPRSLLEEGMAAPKQWRETFKDVTAWAVPSEYKPFYQFQAL